jgi:hypothetical protein
MSPNGEDLSDWTTFPKRSWREYQLSPEQRRSSWRKIPETNTGSESHASRAESAVVKPSPTPTQERLPDPLERSPKVEEVSANSLAEERIASESGSESEESEKYEDPLAVTGGRYW